MKRKKDGVMIGIKNCPFLSRKLIFTYMYMNLYLSIKCFYAHVTFGIFLMFETFLDRPTTRAPIQKHYFYTKIQSISVRVLLFLSLSMYCSINCNAVGNHAGPGVAGGYNNTDSLVLLF